MHLDRTLTPVIPPVTPLPGGFITAQPLPDGRIVVESWWLDLQSDPEHPCTQPVCHWIAADEDEALKLNAEFTSTFARQTCP
jgi:hypothetical protein